MSVASTQLVGNGIYTIAEAARLIRVPPRRIRRWVLGYEYLRGGKQVRSPEVVSLDYDQIEESVALSFRDMIELRFVDAFRRRGVSWHAIRLASRRATELLATDHPFSTRAFRTDGKTILTELVAEERDPDLLDLVKNQYALRRILSRYLYQGIEFSPEDRAERWWPLGRKRRVVVDPRRKFGKPITSEEGVPTQVLYRAVLAEGSEVAVASWFEIDRRSVADAVAFEAGLAA